MTTKIESSLGTLCDILLLSENYQNFSGSAQRVRSYVVSQLAYPDEGSDFDKVFGEKKFLFRAPVVPEQLVAGTIQSLLSQGYDLLMLDFEEKIIGHSAYHVYNDRSLHILSVKVNELFQGQGLANYMVEQTLNEARRKELFRVRVGGGNNAATNHIHTTLANREDELHIKVRENNWVDIVY